MFNSVIDIGASDGRWSAALMKEFPHPEYLLIEAQSCHRLSLQQFCNSRPRCRYTLAAAGAMEGKLYFDATSPFGGVASYKPFAANCIEVPVTTVDAEVEARGLKPPFLIKLDTHGFEIPILNGAKHTLQQTVALIIECYNFRISPESILFYQMCSFLEEQQFRCIDLYDLLYRPDDGSLWQMDMLFVRANRAEFDYNRFT